MESNRFIEKFKRKSIAELEQIIDSPSSFEPEAISAAKHLIRNPFVEPVVIKPIVESINKRKVFFKYKMALDIGVVLFLLLAIASLTKQEMFAGSGDISWGINIRISINGWYSIAFGTGAYLLRKFHKPWLLERAKSDKHVARVEVFKHWMIFCFIVFLSLFFLLK